MNDFKLDDILNDGTPPESNVVNLFGDSTTDPNISFSLESFLEQRRQTSTFDESEIERCLSNCKFNDAYRIYTTIYKNPLSFQEFLTERLDIGLM